MITFINKNRLRGLMHIVIPKKQSFLLFHFLFCCLGINQSMASFTDLIDGLGELSTSALFLDAPSFATSSALRFPATLLDPETQHRLTLLFRIHDSISRQLATAFVLVILTATVFRAVWLSVCIATLLLVSSRIWVSLAALFIAMISGCKTPEHLSCMKRTSLSHYWSRRYLWRPLCLPRSLLNCTPNFPCLESLLLSLFEVLFGHNVVHLLH